AGCSAGETGPAPDREGRRTTGCILRPMTQPGTTPDDRKASARGAARAVTAEAGSAVPTTHAAKRRAKAEKTPKPAGPRGTNGSTAAAPKIAEPDLAALRTKLVAT